MSGLQRARMDWSGRECDLSDCGRVSTTGGWFESELEGPIWVCDLCYQSPPPKPKPQMQGQEVMFPDAHPDALYTEITMTEVV